MERHFLRRVLSAVFVATVAAAIVVPVPVFACSAKSSVADCCCKHQHTPSPQNCLTKTCGCCRPAAPQNIPSERPTFNLTWATLAADAPAFHGGSELTVPIRTNAAGDLAVIPHRILHCSWLI